MGSFAKAKRKNWGGEGFLSRQEHEWKRTEEEEGERVKGATQLPRVRSVQWAEDINVDVEASLAPPSL